MVARVTLTALEGELEGQEFAFTGRAVCSVGRAADCSLRLPGRDLLASRHHCLLEIEAPTVRVLDLGSRNGTYVNGIRIRVEAGLPACLSAGDELQVGQTVFRIDQQELDDLAPAARPSRKPADEASAGAVGC